MGPVIEVTRPFSKNNICLGLVLIYVWSCCHQDEQTERQADMFMKKDAPRDDPGMPQPDLCVEKSPPDECQKPDQRLCDDPGMTEPDLCVEKCPPNDQTECQTDMSVKKSVSRDDPGIPQPDLCVNKSPQEECQKPELRL